MITNKLAVAICKATEELIEIIQDDEVPQAPIQEIHIVQDQHTRALGFTHLCVYAELGDNTRAYTYKYAMYINKETCQVECDGY